MLELTGHSIDTTRKPRPGEVNGKDYHFVEKDDMVNEVEAGKFIESATFSGNMYGKVCVYVSKVKDIHITCD